MLHDHRSKHCHPHAFRNHESGPRNKKCFLISRFSCQDTLWGFLGFLSLIFLNTSCNTKGLFRRCKLHPDFDTSTATQSTLGIAASSAHLPEFHCEIKGRHQWKQLWVFLLSRHTAVFPLKGKGSKGCCWIIIRAWRKTERESSKTAGAVSNVYLGRLLRSSSPILPFAALFTATSLPTGETNLALLHCHMERDGHRDIFWEISTNTSLLGCINWFLKEQLVSLCRSI